jgi:hypothetical protein
VTRRSRRLGGSLPPARVPERPRFGSVTTRESTEAIGHDIPAAAPGWSRWTFWIDPVF